MTYTFIWVAIIVISALVEITTAALISIWFALGAAVALAANFLGASTTVQVVLFLATSLITFTLCFKFLKSKHVLGRHDTKSLPTSLEALVGSTAIINEPINNTANTGTVTVFNGVRWRAYTDSNEVLQQGKVEVLAIEGNRLRVTKLQQNIAAQPQNKTTELQNSS